MIEDTVKAIGDAASFAVEMREVNDVATRICAGLVTIEQETMSERVLPMALIHACASHLVASGGGDENVRKGVKALSRQLSLTVEKMLKIRTEHFGRTL